MAQLPIYIYGASVLKEKTREMKKVDDTLLNLIFNMFETMHNAKGIGLAANQVGFGKSVCVVDLSEMEKEEDRHEPIILINPVIIEMWGDQIPFEEGCLSLPNIREEIVRPELISVKFRDANFEWKEIQAKGFLSRVIQHEVDHLNGIYFTDHLKGLKKKIITTQLNKMKKGDVDADYPIVTNVDLVPA